MMMKIPVLAGVLLVAALLAFAVSGASQKGKAPLRPQAPAQIRLAKATFAGGCFWCMEPPFEKLAGVTSVTSGYTGGEKKNPTYEEVSAGNTGHAESVEVLYDPRKVSYEKLLDVFWHNVDPTTPNGQFCDFGTQYRTAIFYHDETQKRLAEESAKKLQQQLKDPIVTQIVPAGPFYPAEEYHQDYYKKNAFRYKFYRYNCGRDQRLEQLWGKAAEKE
jgi:peptide-methionine (S)-S-oxide reductase